MNFERYVEIVLASSPEDWELIHHPVFLEGHSHLMVLKSDLGISIATGLMHPESFKEAWVEVFPDKKALSQWVDMLWNGSPVRRELRVLVDGARCGLPVPSKRGEMFVPATKVQLFKLVDTVLGGQEFDRYFKQAGMDKVSQPWP